MLAGDSSRYRLAVVILNYRTPQTTIACLQTLLPQLAQIPSRVIVVDNDSGDDSADRIGDWIREQDAGSQVSLVVSDFNGGFSYGNNLGKNSCEADFYLFLNSDTLLREEAIERLMATAVDNPGAGLVSPRLEFADGRVQESCFRFHTPISEFCNAAQTGIFDRLLQKYQVTLDAPSSVISTQWTSFACILIRQEVFAAIGPMEEAYFMYFEDAEFCLRANREGWQVLHNPAAKVVHLRGGSSDLKQNITLKKRLPRYYYESRTRYFYQLYGWVGLTAANLCWNFGRVISSLRQLMGRQDKSTIDRQWRDIWINWLRPLAKYTHPAAANR